MPKLTLNDLPTPALVIDAVTVDRNLARLAEYGRIHNIKIRPHTKTHKSLVMARKQVSSGSEGLTVAKVGEARVMAEASNDIFMAYPGLDPTRTAALAELAKTKTVRVGVDSAYAVDALAAAAVAAGSTIGVLVDVDIGFHRTGVQTTEESLALAQLISNSKGVRLDGIMYYPGHAWLQGEPLAQEMDRIQAAVKAVVDLWGRHGLKAPIVSGGSTPTMLASHLTPVTTEIRPGTYIYNDKNTLAGGYCKLEDCAAHIICTVVSNAVPGKCVIDGGTKTFTSDRLATDPNNGGFGLIVEYPDAKIVRFSEEHGEVDLSQCAKKPQLGERVHVIPNHICPCVNLQDTAWIQFADGTLEPLKIEARGQLS